MDKKHDLELNKIFPVIEASKLSLDDEFLKHRPKTESQRKFKKALREAIKTGLYDFRKSKMDPSEDEYGKICFKIRQKPALNHSCEWWYETALGINPAKNSRLGSEKEYIAFLGVIIKELVEKFNYSVDYAWETVCDQSKNIGYYRDTPGWSVNYEKTGKHWFDFANTQKILHKVTPFSKFKVASGSCFDYGDSKPLVYTEIVFNPSLIIEEYVGWIVMDP